MIRVSDTVSVMAALDGVTVWSLLNLAGYEEDRQDLIYICCDQKYFEKQPRHVADALGYDESDIKKILKIRDFAATDMFPDRAIASYSKRELFEMIVSIVNESCTWYGITYNSPRYALYGPISAIKNNLGYKDNVPVPFTAFKTIRDNIRTVDDKGHKICPCCGKRI